MFERLQHIECVDNADEPRLVVGAFYSVKEVWTAKDEPWHVEVYGHEDVKFSNEYFKPASRMATIEDFDRAFPELDVIGRRNQA